MSISIDLLALVFLSKTIKGMFKPLLKTSQDCVSDVKHMKGVSSYIGFILGRLCEVFTAKNPGRWVQRISRA